MYGSSITISWNYSNNSPLTQYQIQSALDNIFTIGLKIFSTSTSPFTLEELNYNTTYYIRVKANGISQSDSIYTLPISTTTFATKPTASYSTIGSTYITVSWLSPNPSWTYYNLILSSDNFLTIYSSSLLQANSYTFSNLIPNTSYFFKIAALNANGTYSDYDILNTTLTYSNIPTTSAVTFIETGNDYIKLQFNKNSNPDYTQYYVFVATSADFQGLDLGPKSWQNINIWYITGLNPGTTYYFRVKSRDIISRESNYLYLQEVVLSYLQLILKQTLQQNFLP